MNRKEDSMYNHKMDQWGYIHNTKVTLLEDWYRKTDHKILGQQIMIVADKYVRLSKWSKVSALIQLRVKRRSVWTSYSIPLHYKITLQNEPTSSCVKHRKTSQRKLKILKSAFRKEILSRTRTGKWISTFKNGIIFN